jgi:hypothetical protein
MKLSFIPGNLFLAEDDSGSYCVSFRNDIVLVTKSKKKAIEKYNEIRKELEAAYPSPELTQVQKEELRRQASLDSMLSHNSLRAEIKKKAAKSRTFG